MDKEEFCAMFIIANSEIRDKVYELLTESAQDEVSNFVPERVCIMLKSDKQ